jgi:uncharacterized membrane protein YhfC
MDPALRVLNAAAMIALPLLLGAFLARRFGLSWSLFGWGAVTFVGSQVVHLPLLEGLTLALHDASALRAHALLTNAIILGVAAGVCEEGARYLAYRFLVPRARSWPEGLMLGAGHGGMEAILLGGLSGVALVHAGAVPALAAASFVPLIGAAERVFALADHLALSVMVLQVFVRRRWSWLLLAIGWHGVLDGVAVYAGRTVSLAMLESLLAVLALASVAIVVALRPRAHAAG